MEEKVLPEYWRSTIEDLEDTLKLVKKGTVKQVGVSAGKRPIYKIEYGKSNVKLGRANLSSALGARDIKCFADKTGEDYVPTLFLCGSVHGGEFEGTMALLNLIKLMETGTDYAGVEHPELLSLMEQIHLVLIPIANPDGRSRVPYRSVVGMSFEEFRYYDQGTWKNGELCGWPGCKTIHPIKDECEFLGAYFNDDGVNMVHEDFFGKVSNESTALLDVCRYDVPDLTIQLHGGTNALSGIVPTEYSSEQNVEKCNTLANTVKAVCEAEGIPCAAYKVGVMNTAFGITGAMYHVSGAPAVTFESNQGLDYGKVICTYDQIYRSHILLFEESAKFVLATKVK